MKKLLFILLTLVSLSSIAANRIATAADVILYGSYITVGDLIIDTPTKVFPDNINQLRYTTISKSFPGLRENAVIWIDGLRMGQLCEIRFLNGTETTPWLISSATLKPIPGTRVSGVITQNSYGGFLYLIQGLKNFRLEGSNDAYPGLPGLKSGQFLKGRFGFGATSTGYYGGYHMYSISVLNGGSVYLEGFEGEHGFSIARVEGGSYDYTVSLEITNFYIHDSGSEGQYLGATHAPPYARIKDLKISNGVIARSGSEALQMQHLIGDAWIRNVTIFSPDAGYLNQFQPGQDTGIQLSPDEGNIIVENISVDSWGSHGLNLFGTDFQSTTKNTIIRNMLFNNGRGEAIYIHPSCKYGMNWTIDNISIRNMNGEYYINNKTTEPNWIVSPVNGTDKFTMTNMVYKDLPDIDYVNSGFSESADRIKFYSRYYAKYISGLDTLAVQYKAGDIIVDREPLTLPVFTKCIADFTATSVRPKRNTNCITLTWDSNSVRSDSPLWCSTCDQMSYPPDDLRVEYNNYYGLKNIGFVQEKPSYESLETLVATLQAQVISKDSTIAANQVLFNEVKAQAQSLQGRNYDLEMEIKSILSGMDSVVSRYRN